jgi:hypothetical protein
MTDKLVSGVLFASILFVFTTSSLAGWELYDDFSSEAIDTQKWNVDNSSADISAENGQAKFVHQSGHPNDSGYLLFNQDPGNIIGIKAKIFIDTCSGDVRARIAGYGGKVGENHIWSGLQLQPGDQRIYTNSGLEGPSPDYTWVEDLHYAHFQNPITVTGVSFDLTMEFSSDKITYEVDGLGKIAYKYATSIAAPDDLFRAIGTRSSNGDGPCTVYFDDVYVLRP